MHILVATRNRSKYTFVADWLHHIQPNVKTTPLYETSLDGDVYEQGSIEERALQKARYYLQTLKEAGENSYDAVLGIDDGIQVADGVPTPNSKEMTDDILAAKWPIGTPVFILRAYALVRPDGVPSRITTKLRFTFMGNPHGVQRKEGIYPLEEVLAPEGYNVPWSRMTTDDINAFTQQQAPQLSALFSAQGKA